MDSDAERRPKCDTLESVVEVTDSKMMISLGDQNLLNFWMETTYIDLPNILYNGVTLSHLRITSYTIDRGFTLRSSLIL